MEHYLDLGIHFTEASLSLFIIFEFLVFVVFWGAQFWGLNSALHASKQAFSHLSHTTSPI
jgi:hypothetical protein